MLELSYINDVCGEDLSNERLRSVKEIECQQTFQHSSRHVRLQLFESIIHRKAFDHLLLEWKQFQQGIPLCHKSGKQMQEKRQHNSVERNEKMSIILTFWGWRKNGRHSPRITMRRKRFLPNHLIPLLVKLKLSLSYLLLPSSLKPQFPRVFIHT